MDELIKNLTQGLNINANQANGGMGLLLNLAKEKLNGSDFSSILKHLGGETVAQNAMAAAPATTSSGGGLMGALGSITSALGVNTGGLGALAQLAGGFNSLNIDQAMIAKFGQIVGNYLQEKGGSEVKSILEKIMKA